MRLLYIFSQFALRGGTERIFIAKMNYLADVLGYEVHSLAGYQRDDEPNAYQTSEKIIQHRFGLPYLSISLVKPWKYFIDRRYFISRLQEEINKVNPDFVMISTVSTRNIIDIKLPSRTKLILESHCIRSRMWLDSPWFIRLRRYRQLRKEEELASKVVCLTNADASLWHGGKTAVIPNFIEMQPKTCAEDYDVQSKKAVALGRFHSQKGFDLLIKAWQRVHESHPDWQLQIGGYESEKGTEEMLTSLVKQLKLNDSIILGPRIVDVKAFLSNASFFVLSSRYEGFGLVLLEAMTCGLPCVSFDCPAGPSDIITHRKDGLLVEPNKISKLADAICYMIEHPDERRCMAEAAIDKARQFDRDKIMHQWTGLFKSLQYE